jgi:Zn-dependent protease with chaperone function
MNRRLLASALALLVVLAAQPARAQSITNPDLFAKSLTAAQEAIKEYGRYENPKELARINRIGYELGQQSAIQKFPLTFELVNAPEPNAFSLPGGQVFVTRGLLDLGVDDDMLANVLGHEIGHVTLDHYQRIQRKATLLNVLGNVLVAGVLIGAERGRSTSGPEAPYDPRVGYYDRGGSLVQGAAATSLVVSELLLRSYSREHEDEADQEGQHLAAAAGYDPAGAQRFWELMNKRAPQIKEYGYMQTHPFADERIRSAEARKGSLKIQAHQNADAYRLHTQTVLMGYVERPKVPPEAVAFLKQAALVTWPQGKTADSLRLERLHKGRDQELAKPQLSRDYGAVVATYRKELAEVRAVDPKSELVATLDHEVGDLETKRKDLYPRAVEVLGGGVYETSFLIAFLSNFPDAKQVPEVALALGDAYSRLGNQTEAVTRYMAAWEAAPDSAEGKRARAGLRNLAPLLKELAALQQLAAQDRDPEIKRVAGDRLAKVAKTYDDLANGAEYLRRYPEGPHALGVLDRLNVLADNLYGEVVLYQGMGDPVKAIERINKILTNAPLSPAAERLRDRAVVTEKAEKTG